jgi:DNA-binding XRE family transcriptional regulator
MSLADLAAQVGVSKGAVHHYETGRCHPRLVHADKLARALGVTMESLLAASATRP